MLGWSEWLLTASVVVVVWKWRSIPQVGLQIRSAIKNFREGVKDDPPPRIRDVPPYEEKKKDD